MKIDIFFKFHVFQFQNTLQNNLCVKCSIYHTYRVGCEWVKMAKAKHIHIYDNTSCKSRDLKASFYSLQNVFK